MKTNGFTFLHVLWMEIPILIAFIIWGYLLEPIKSPNIRRKEAVSQAGDFSNVLV